MDSQWFDYWMPQNNRINAHHTTCFGILPGLSETSSLSPSPISATFDTYSSSLPQDCGSVIAEASARSGSYNVPLSTADLVSRQDSPYCSPCSLLSDESVFAQVAPESRSTERTHIITGRRRAQNRAAQRAFRERKEKYARDLERQLAALTDRFNKLESSHRDLNIAYDKLRKMVALLTQDDDVEGEVEDNSMNRGRRQSNNETLQKLLDILHGEMKTVIFKTESV